MAGKEQNQGTLSPADVRTQLIEIELADKLVAQEVGADGLARTRSIAMFDPKHTETPSSFLADIIESLDREISGQDAGIILAPYSFTPQGFEELTDFESIRRNFSAIVGASLDNEATFTHPTAGEQPLNCEASFDSGVVLGVLQSPDAPSPYTPEKALAEALKCITTDEDVDKRAVLWHGIAEGLNYKASRKLASLTQ